MPRRVLLIVNRRKASVCAKLPHIRSLIESHGSIAAELDAVTGEPIEDTNGADMIVVLGGDGTLLSEIRRTARLGLPVLGVNLGNLGFLAQFDPAALVAQAQQLFGDGSLRIEERVLLDVALSREDASQPVWAGVAANDCVITAGPPYRMIQLGVTIDRQPLPKIRGDGLVVSTPTGTTAYGVSAGGSIVAPGVHCMALTPIAAHSLAMRPIIVHPDSTVEIHVERANRAEHSADLPEPTAPGAAGTTLVIDGQKMLTVRDDDRLRIRVYREPVRVVLNPDGAFWGTLARKMHWGVQPSNGPD